MITAAFLEKWVPILIPEKYGPEPDITAGKPILEICICSNEKMEKTWLQDCTKDILQKNPELSICGTLVDMYSLSVAAKRERPHFKNKFIIRLNADLPESQAIFTLLHELGHLVGTLEQQEEHDKDKEKFADEFAFDRAAEVIDDAMLLASVLIAGLR